MITRSQSTQEPSLDMDNSSVEETDSLETPVDVWDIDPLVHDASIDEVNLEEGTQFVDASDESECEEKRHESDLEAIAWDMQQLNQNFEKLPEAYRLIDRLGEGTFSSVYKAEDLRHDQHDNIWCRHCPTDSQQSNAKNSSPGHDSLKRKRLAEIDDNVRVKKAKGTTARGKVYVAIKRIYVTSSPTRIENEIAILQTLQGHQNVAHLITAFRHEDQVLAVMPYEKHVDFREFYRNLPFDKVRTYMKCMLAGMAFAHSHNIIHRDVKPANFLFNPETGHGTLCDFGLAEVFNPTDWHSKCLHSLPCPELGLIHGRIMSRPKPLMHQAESNRERFKASQAAARKRGEKPSRYPWHPRTHLSEYEVEDIIAGDDMLIDYYESWAPANETPEGQKKGRAFGYPRPEADRRPSLRANRAGTRGFRAPEVLLKCLDQTIAIDVWSVGVVMLCFLTRRFPFFQASDDVEALMEIATIFGHKKMQVCAALHNRTFITNVPAIVDPEHANLHNLVYALNPRIFDENTPPQYALDSDESDDERLKKWYTPSNGLHQAVDLARKLLALDCTRRISAAEALNHPFFKSALETID